MPYVNVPNDLSKIKTKMAFNLTKRQLVCFGSAGAVGIPAYLLTRATLGNTGAMFLMLGIMLPAFLLAMYEKDGLPFEKVVRNIIRVKFLRPGIRACLPLDCECYMFGKCWTGAYCRYFREAVLPLDPALEAALLTEGPRPDFKACPVCGRAVAPDGRQTYCSAACAKAAHRRQQREYMRKKRG